MVTIIDPTSQNNSYSFSSDNSYKRWMGELESENSMNKGRPSGLGGLPFCLLSRIFPIRGENVFEAFNICG